MERTLILVKPDAFERGLTGEILARFERKGLRIVAMKHMTIEKDLAEQHYAEHRERPFFGDLVEPARDPRAARRRVHRRGAGRRGADRGRAARAGRPERAPEAARGPRPA